MPCCFSKQLKDESNSHGAVVSPKKSTAKKQVRFNLGDEGIVAPSTSGKQEKSCRKRWFRKKSKKNKTEQKENNPEEVSVINNNKPLCKPEQTSFWKTLKRRFGKKKTATIQRILTWEEWKKDENIADHFFELSEEDQFLEELKAEFGLNEEPKKEQAQKLYEGDEERTTQQLLDAYYGNSVVYIQCCNEALKPLTCGPLPKREIIKFQIAPQTPKSDEGAAKSAEPTTVEDSPNTADSANFFKRMLSRTARDGKRPPKNNVKESENRNRRKNTTRTLFYQRVMHFLETRVTSFSII